MIFFLFAVGVLNSKYFKNFRPFTMIVKKREKERERENVMKVFIDFDLLNE